MKGSVRKYKLRQSPANLQKMVEVKEKYQTVISGAKLKVIPPPYPCHAGKLFSRVVPKTLEKTTSNLPKKTC